jgi:hypothetical protein
VHKNQFYNIRRAGHLAQTRVRRRPKEITIRLRLIGAIKKDNADNLGLPAEDTDPEESL